MKDTEDKWNWIVTDGLETPSDFTAMFQTPVALEQELSKLDVYCPVCYTVTRDLGTFSYPEVTPSNENYVLWELQLEELCDAAESGCHFCAFIAYRFFNDRGYTFIFKNSSDRNPIACCRLASEEERSDELWNALKTIRTFCEEYPNTSFRLIAQPSDHDERSLLYSRIQFMVSQTTLSTKESIQALLGLRRQITIEVYANRGSPAANYLKYDPVNTNPLSEHSLSLVKQWISECSEQHSCTSNNTTILPTRVLKIKEDGLQLVDGNTPGRYITLSYCWGGPQSSATTTSTLGERKTGFCVSSLPKTLQDAVHLTQILGVEYLWIDSICILQDSPSDKALELSNIATYFKNSYLTICATGNNCDAGFLHRKDECEHHPGTDIPQDLLFLPFLCPSGAIDVVLFREEQPYQLSLEPVCQRAWTFQEALLSPRMLYYGPRIVWHCQATQTSAGGVENWAADFRNATNRSIQLAIGASRNNLDPVNPLDYWYAAVDEFSARDITHEHDKLPAIAALASETGVLLNDAYIAGLWQSNLLRGLLWSAYPRIAPGKPTVWRAPSWSWASAASRVTYTRRPPRAAIPLADVVSVSAVPVSPAAPYGEIGSAALELAAPLFPVAADVLRQTLRRENELPPLQDSAEVRRDFLSAAMGGQGLQDEKDWEPPEGAMMMPLFATLDEEQKDGDDGGGLLAGLVLADEGDGTYSRVTCFTRVRGKGIWHLKDKKERVRLV